MNDKINSSKSIEWIHCNNCLVKTKHAEIIQKEVTGINIVGRSEGYSEDGISVNWSKVHTLFECCGCETVTLRTRHWFSKWGEETIDEFFPPPISRTIPAWHEKLNVRISELLKEIYTAIQAGSKMLTVMGARSIIDLFMNEHIGDIGGFQQKLKQLLKDGWISKKNMEFLSAALNAGHAVTHRGYKPSINEVNQIMDIIENLLQTQVLLSCAENLRENTPKR